jgi:TPR repeat protein
MWHLHTVLVMRIATADEGFQWLEKAAKQGYPRAVFDVTKQQLKDQPEKLRAAMEGLSKQDNDAGLQALYWFAYGYEKGQDGLPKDAAKATDYRNRAKALGDKLLAADKAK